MHDLTPVFGVGKHWRRYPPREVAREHGALLRERGLSADVRLARRVKMESAGSDMTSHGAMASSPGDLTRPCQRGRAFVILTRITYDSD